MGWEFLITALVIVVLPGTGVLYTLAIGLGRGRRAAVVAATGCTLGIVPHLAASLIGLAALLHASALAFQALKLAGVAYLLWLAWSIVRAKGTIDLSPDPAPVPAWRVIRTGILINVLNPKLSVFFLAFLPQFVPPDHANPAAAMLPLALVFMAMTWVVFVGYGALAGTARRAIFDRPAVLTGLRWTVAGAFTLLAARLAVARIGA